MDWIVVLLVGGVIGWGISLAIHVKTKRDTVADILIGMTGAVLGQWLFSSVLGIGVANDAGLIVSAGLIWGAIGAVLLIGVLRLITSLN